MQESHADALDHTRQTAQHLKKYAATKSFFQLPFFSYIETAEVWTMYETFLVSCLKTGDDQAAHRCLENLINRFGATNERIMGLQGLYREAVAMDHSALEKILKDYDDVLAEDPINIPIAKRRISLLRHLSRIREAVDGLINLLEASPTDIEAWMELADLYQSQGLFSQAEFCLEEILLVAPNAWNIHSRLGEILYQSAINGAEADLCRTLVDSIRRFCRSVELCDWYLRGFYGLKLASNRLLTVLSKSSDCSKLNPDSADNMIPSVQTLNQLSQKATEKLAEIISPHGSDGYNKGEMHAAKRLLTDSL